MRIVFVRRDMNWQVQRTTCSFGTLFLSCRPFPPTPTPKPPFARAETIDVGFGRYVQSRSEDTRSDTLKWHTRLLCSLGLQLKKPGEEPPFPLYKHTKQKQNTTPPATLHTEKALRALRPGQGGGGVSGTWA
jgi:hypothetical protein